MKRKEIKSKIFPVSFFEDDRIKFIDSEFGSDGVTVLFKLYASILKKSYYFEWNNQICKKFASTVLKGISSEKIKKVINRALELDIFNIDRFKNYGVLTSFYFQQNFFSRQKSDKAANVQHPEYLIEEKEVKDVQSEELMKEYYRKEEEKEPLIIENYEKLEEIFGPNSKYTKEEINSLPEDMYISREALADFLKAKVFKKDIDIDLDKLDYFDEDYDEDEVVEDEVEFDEKERLHKEPVSENYTLKSGKQKMMITRECQSGETGELWQEYLILTYDLSDEELC